MAETTAPAEDALVSALAHSRSATEVLEVLGSSGDGLDGDSARERLAAHGPNKLPEKRPRPAILRFFAHFNNVLIYILVAAGVLKAILGEWVDCAVIVSVAVINAAVGFIQEGRAQRALDSIRGMLSVTAQVRRDGHWQQVDAQTLVPGDIVRIASGDRIPADMRLLAVANLRVEESALTGESLPAKKDVAEVGPDAGLGDRMSMVYSGTIVAAGSATGVVTATGTHTEIGRIQSLIADVETIDTPLTRKLARFGRQLSVGILGAAAVMLVVGKLVHQFTVSELITAAIGFAVAAIPEGLPAVVTITLALGVQQMARRRAITRKLPAVEALGAVNVICSDKTGTLTQNEMTARTVVTARHRFDVTGTGYRPEGGIELDGTPITPADHPDLAALLTTMAVCNDARLDESDGQWRVVGEPTEGALRTLTQKAQIDDADWPRLVAGATLAEFFVARAGGYPLAVAQTAAVNMLALGQLAYLLNCRFVTSSSLRPQVFRGNPWVWRMAGAMIALQLVFTYAPFMHTWFHSAPITIRGWAVAVALSVVIFLTIETAKWVGRRFMPEWAT
ncbi:HAD-IC family P-type ATPase [Mycolicibacterium sp. XJ775]